MVLKHKYILFCCLFVMELYKIAMYVQLVGTILSTFLIKVQSTHFNGYTLWTALFEFLTALLEYLDLIQCLLRQQPQLPQW